MEVEPVVTLLVSILAGLVAAFAEWLHTRRVHRARFLAFGPTGRARVWTRGVPVIRALGMATACWGLLTLLQFDGAPVKIDPISQPKRRLLIALDVSPSMGLKDAGPDSKTARDTRAREALKSILERLDLTTTRVSIVAFYTSAKPVVVDTWDLNIVANILDDLPLEYAFKEGPTAMYSGVREAAALAAKWPPNSTTLLVISDGDTIPEVEPPKMPAAISRVLVLGVGNPYRGVSIAGRSSKQDAAALKTLAARLKGTYVDVNQRHVPTSLVTGLWPLRAGDSRVPDNKTLAIIATTAGSTVLALAGPLLAFFGSPRRHGKPAVRGATGGSAVHTEVKAPTGGRANIPGSSFGAPQAAQTTAPGGFR